MSTKNFNSLDDYERFLRNTVTPWSREQRIALAAGMAERWLPVCDAFFEEYECGDPAAFQRAVQSVWNCVPGRALTAKEHKLHKQRVEENTPHLGDFDAENVIAASAMIEYALNCCLSADNTDDAVMAMVSGFEAVAPGIYTEAGEFPPDWPSPDMRDQLNSQLKSAMDNVPPIDEQEIDEYRRQFMSLNAVTDEGVGPLPAEIWQSPEIRDQLEATLKLQKAFSDIVPMMAQQIEAMRQEHVPPDAEAEQAAQDIWKSPRVQDELEKQLKLLKLIGDMSRIDTKQIDALRPKLVSPDLAGSPAPRDSCPSALSNEAIFERYRGEAEGFITNKQLWEEAVHTMEDTEWMAMPYFRAWAFRYSRRKRAMEERPMIDAVAHKALLARHSMHDAAAKDDPGWNTDTRACIEQGYQMDFEFEFDVRSPDQPHGYGPSLRRLYIERKLAGDSEQNVWKSILDWACHRPPAWDEEDRRKKKGLAFASPQLGERLTREISWRTTHDVDQPWTTEVDGQTWRIRLNDYPDDIMYTLIVHDEVIGKFHDWPECWRR